MNEKTITYVANYFLDTKTAFAEVDNHGNIDIIHKATGEVLITREFVKGFTYINSGINEICMLLEDIAGGRI